jgi:hypothetical protein
MKQVGQELFDSLAMVWVGSEAKQTALCRPPIGKSQGNKDFPTGGFICKIIYNDGCVCHIYTNAVMMVIRNNITA